MIEQTGVRRLLVAAPETRRLAEYGRPAALTEEELLAGYRVRIEMLREATDAPCCRYKPTRGRCPCGGHQ